MYIVSIYSPLYHCWYGVCYHLQSRGKRSRTADLQAMNLTSYHLTIPQSTGEDLNLQNPKAPDLQSGRYQLRYTGRSARLTYTTEQGIQKGVQTLWSWAGAGGFEPLNAAVKVLCLRPLGDAPIYTPQKIKFCTSLSSHGVLSFWQPYINHHLAAAYNPRRKLHLAAQTFLADFHTIYFLFLKL